MHGFVLLALQAVTLHFLGVDINRRGVGVVAHPARRGDLASVPHCESLLEVGIGLQLGRVRLAHFRRPFAFRSLEAIEASGGEGLLEGLIGFDSLVGVELEEHWFLGVGGIAD